MAGDGGNFGLVGRIEAHTFGEPGQRTFRIWAAIPGRSATLWLEKEQLIALASAIDELLESIPAGAGAQLSDQHDLPDPADTSDLEFHVGSLALGYDQQSDMLRIYAGLPDAFQTDPPAFSCMLTRGQIEGVRAQLDSILRSGRPICPLCHEPMDPGGHACVRTNGHSKKDIPPRPE